VSGQLTLFVDGYFANPFDATCFVALTEKQLPFSVARPLLRDTSRIRARRTRRPEPRDPPR
jgi:hypothetical protein